MDSMVTMGHLGDNGTWAGDSLGTTQWGWGRSEGDNVMLGPTSPPAAPIAHRAICGAQVGGWGGMDSMVTMRHLGDTHRGTMGCLETMWWGWGQPKG